MKSEMRLLIAVVLLVTISGCTTSVKEKELPQEEQIEIIVNPAIDLFGLISRLAGVSQYTEVLLPEYLTELENSFDHLRDHPSIEFARECNIRHQINGDVPMVLAVYVGPPPALELRMDLSNIPHSFDPRWDSALISDYLEQARIFAEESKYMEFHMSKSDFHLQARQSLTEMINREQIFHWYKEFFGYYPENFKM